MTPNKHYDLIVAWALCAGLGLGGAVGAGSAEGTVLAGAALAGGVWHWLGLRVLAAQSYRIKPEPKPDVVVYGNVEWTDVQDGNLNYRNFIGFANSNLVATDNVKYTFCGETGKLKKAEVIDEA